MNISKEAKVGFIGLVILFTILFVFDTLRRKNVFSTNMIITATFDELNFIKKGDMVLIKGRQYGVVSAIYKEGETLLVDMDVESGVRIPPSAKAVIAEESLLGGRIISITFNGSCETDCLESGARIPGEVTSMQKTVAETVGPMLKSFGKFADTLMGPNGMQSMLDKAHAATAGLAKTTKGLEQKMRGMNRTLPGTIKSFRELTESLLNTDASLSDAAIGAVNASGDKSMIMALDSLVQNLSSLSQEDIEAMTQMLYSAKKMAEGMPPKIEKGQKMVDKMDSTMDSLLVKVGAFQKGAKGTIPKLLYDGPYKDTLNHKIQNISQAILDIKTHPEEKISLKKK